MIIDAISGVGGGAGGHAIVNPSGTEMPKEKKLQFTGNVSVSDDSTNNATVVEVTDSGHEIIDSSDTSMTQRTGLQFATGFSVTDDSANDRTVVETFSGSYNDLTDVPTSTVKTATDTFSTVNGGLLSKCEVELSPVQDLHGYDHPWPAGGGANKWDEEWEVGILVDNGALNVNSDTRRTTSFIPVMPNTEYYATNDYVLNGRVAYYDENKNCVYYSSSGLQSRNITTPNDAYYLRITLNMSYGTTYKHDISINYPSTATSYEPYSNICPISGHTESKVKRVGTNLAYVNSGNNIVIAHVKGGVTYTFSMSHSYDVGLNLYAGDTEGTRLTTANSYSSPLTFTPEEDCPIFLNGFGNESGHSFADSAYNYQIEVGSKASPFEPYSERIYTINLGGTYYGGTVDFVSGKFVADRGYIASYNSETLPSTWISDRDEYASGTTPTVGAEVVYKLATPLEIDLTPTQIDALAGDNNLFAPIDFQEINGVEYKDIFSWQDVKKAIAYKEGLEIVSFANGTDAQINAMLDAYYADEITWEEMGWSVGDTRTIHLNAMAKPSPASSGTWVAQDIVAVILDHDNTDLATPINGHTKHCIAVGFREVMNNMGAGSDTTNGIYVNGDASLDTVFKKWSELYLRTFLNSTVLNAMSTTFKSMIKDTAHYCHTAYNTADDELVVDTLYLASYPQLCGTTSYSEYVPTTHKEGTQLEYYKIAVNRIKYGNNNGVPSSSKATYWNGSASSRYTANGYAWGILGASGNAGFDYGNTAYGLCPIFGM